MKKIFKRTVGAALSAIIAISSMCFMSAFAAEEQIPEGLPEGAVMIYPGIYEVENNTGIMPLNDYEDINIGTVRPDGVITQPSSLRSVIIDSGDNWICMTSTAYIRINFVNGNTSIFGSDYLQWPAIGTSSTKTYYIDVDYYNIRANTPYVFQCTSANGRTYNNVTINLFTTVGKINI